MRIVGPPRGDTVAKKGRTSIDPLETVDGQNPA